MKKFEFKKAGLEAISYKTEENKVMEVDLTHKWKEVAGSYSRASVLRQVEAWRSGGTEE